MRLETSRTVAIVVSDKLPVYQEVADALSVRLAGSVRYELDGDSRRMNMVSAKLQDQKMDVIAVGPMARSLVTSTNGTVVYCQDLLAEEARAVPGAVRGVRATPPAAKQLHAWKTLDPRLQRIVLLRGASGAAFARNAQTAAQQLKLQLDDIEVGSDREVLYAVKNLGADVQGLWLIPDGKVLSSTVLREALAFALRQGKQTLVFSQELLGLGALLSAEPDPADVAERAIEQLRADDPRVVALQRVRVRINKEVAKQLGINLPAAMQTGMYVYQ